MKVKQDKIKSQDVQTQNKTCVIKDMFASLFLSFVGEDRKMTKLFSRVHATLQPALSVGLSVCRSVCHTLLFLSLLFLLVIFSHSK